MESECLCIIGWRVSFHQWATLWFPDCRPIFSPVNVVRIFMVPVSIKKWINFRFRKYLNAEYEKLETETLLIRAEEFWKSFEGFPYCNIEIFYNQVSSDSSNRTSGSNIKISFWRKRFPKSQKSPGIPFLPDSVCGLC